jgi:hypothetical protein
LPSTAGNSLFAKTAELRATVEKIRAIEAANPTLAKFPATVFPAGTLCSKKDLEQAQRHLTSITAKTPRRPFAALNLPAIAKAPTKPAALNVGRSAQDFLLIDTADQNELIFSALPQAAKPLRDELRAAYKSAPAALQAKFAKTFQAALKAHEIDLAPAITKQAFDQLTARQKSDTCKAGIKITN